MYGKLVVNKKTVKVFLMIDDFVPDHVKKILAKDGGVIEAATPDEYLDDYADKNNGLPSIDN